MSIGRLEIFTDESEITSQNVIKVLRKAMPMHLINAAKCEFLLRYEAGEQPLKRKKKYRADIDINVSDNLANEITEFKLGFNHGNPITLVQRGEKDSGNKNEAEAISLLNECFWGEKYEAKSQQRFRFMEITGLGYSYIDINTEYQDGDSYFTYNTLDPRTTFIIKSSYYVDHRPMLAVSYREDDYGNRYFTCFSKYQRFEISSEYKIKNGEIKKDDKGNPITDWFEREKSGEKNPLEIIPIVEWIRSYDRMGCFERQIPEMDALNIAVSDFFNDVDQNCQAIFHANDIEFPKDEQGEEQQPKTNDWVVTNTTQDGKTPFINPIAIAYDYNGMLANISFRRAVILQKCNVPQRSEASNATGIAVSDATGWTNAEVEAGRQDLIKDSCKMEEVKVALRAIKKNPYVPSDSPLLTLRYCDAKPNISRQKNYEMTSKINTYATGVSHGISPKHMIPAINFFPDPQQVIADSEPFIERYLRSAFNEQNNNSGTDPERKPNADRLEQDYSDQTENSPMLDSDRS